MSSEWKTLCIRDLGRVVTGKTPKTSDVSNFGGMIPFVTPTDMDGRKLINSTSRYLSEIGVSTVRNSLIPAGSVMVSCIGSDMGKVVIAGEPCVTNQQINSIVVDPKFSSQFVYYNLSMRKAELQHLASGGSTMPILNKGNFSEIKIDIPSLSEQIQIASLLSSFDDRITLLRETNATLESIAQALFKSWFVDFDPIRAKMEGRAPEGMDEATAALFPDSFEESELGLVPKGWFVSTVGEVVETVGGGTPDTKDSSYWEPTEHCWTTPKDLSGITAPVLLDTERKLSAKGIARISSGLQPTGTLLMSSRAPIGYLAIAQMPVAINQGYIAMPPGSKLPPLYMLYWCQQNMDTIKNHANGSTFMEISKKAFRPLPILVPAAGVLEKFVGVADALFDRLVENERQAKTLAALRDTLLPHLISGRLRLPAD